MRIVVNDIAASHGGAMTILKEFYNCVRNSDTENEWIFLLGDNYLEETDNIKVITFPHVKNSKLKKMQFDFYKGKKVISDFQPDVVFSLQNIITFGLRVPQITYIHQAIPFQTAKKFSFLKGSERSTAVYQYLIGAIIKRSVKKADKTIVQTGWMKTAVCQKCCVSDERVSVISPNLSDLSSLVQKSELDPTAFFYPTSSAIYKNNVCLTEASRILSAEGYSFKATMTVPEDEKHENVYCIGKIPYEDVIRRYNSETLVFPSYIESFGYPLVEARAAGTVILASDCPFSRELLDGYENAYFFDPFSPRELAGLMKRVIEGDIVKKDVNTDSIKPHNNWIDVISEIKSTAGR